MPWTVKDVPSHMKGLSPHQAQVWVAAANNALADCEKKGGDNCDASAIRIANAAAGRVKESGLPEGALQAVQLLSVLDNLQEPGRVISNVNEQRLRLAITQLQAVLAQLVKERQGGDGAPGGDPQAQMEAYQEALAEGIAILYETPIGRAHEEADADGGEPDLVALREDGAFDVDGDVIPLGEAGLRADGTFPVKIIKPGWGSSGYYLPEALKRDGPKIFKAGVHMYVDHPTRNDESQRPERSVKDLAAILTRDAAWQEQGPEGPGLYAEGKVFAHWKPFLDELAPHTGVSIRALGKGREGVMEGRKGTIVESLVAAKSVDFVTAAGAGGRVLQLFESARDGSTAPLPPAHTGTEETVAIDEKAFSELKESYDGLQTKFQEQAATMARLQERELLREATDFASGLINPSRLPEPVKQRLLREAVRDMAVKDGALDREATKAVVETLVKEAATEYEAIVGSGQIRGMGSTGTGEELDEAKADERLVELYKRQGFSESAALKMVAGR